VKVDSAVGGILLVDTFQGLKIRLILFINDESYKQRLRLIVSAAGFRGRRLPGAPC
jgi:hypothetical protein